MGIRKYKGEGQKMDTELIELIESVIEQIVEDVRNGDLTAIQELLVYCEVNALKQYLPEGKHT